MQALIVTVRHFSGDDFNGFAISFQMASCGLPFTYVYDNPRVCVCIIIAANKENKATQKANKLKPWVACLACC